MYEFHGWFGLAESTYESDTGGLTEAIEEVKRLAKSFTWPSVNATVHILNGQCYLVLTGHPNRRREEAVAVEDIVELVRQRLPGSWGLLYERDDEMPVPPGPGAYRVTVLARGRTHQHLDPFLSPFNPTIED